jgi:hypothetical protein
MRRAGLAVTSPAATAFTTIALAVKRAPERSRRSNCPLACKSSARPRVAIILNHGTQRCISCGSLRVDAAVAGEVIERVQPLGVEAALAALEGRGREDAAKRRQVELAPGRAGAGAGALRGGAGPAAIRRRRSDNRLVAGELERRWDERLKEERRLREELDAFGRLDLHHLYRAMAWLGEELAEDQRTGRHPSRRVA